VRNLANFIFFNKTLNKISHAFKANDRPVLNITAKSEMPAFQNKKEGSIFREWSSWGAPPHQLGGPAEHCKLPQWGPRQSASHQSIFVIF